MLDDLRIAFVFEWRRLSLQFECLVSRPMALRPTPEFLHTGTAIFLLGEQVPRDLRRRVVKKVAPHAGARIETVDLFLR